MSQLQLIAMLLAPRWLGRSAASPVTTLHNIYTQSIQYLYNIYTISAHYLHYLRGRWPGRSGARPPDPRLAAAGPPLPHLPHRQVAPRSRAQWRVSADTARVRTRAANEVSRRLREVVQSRALTHGPSRPTIGAFSVILKLRVIFAKVHLKL